MSNLTNVWHFFTNSICHRHIFNVLRVLVSELCPGQILKCIHEQRTIILNCAMHFYSMRSICLQSFLLIPLVVSELCPGQFSQCKHEQKTTTMWSEGLTEIRTDGQSGDYMLSLRGHKTVWMYKCTKIDHWTPRDYSMRHCLRIGVSQYYIFFAANEIVMITFTVYKESVCF